LKRIGLALGGGGARGLCHIEFIIALDELGIKPDIISGTSMGSIIGGFYASGVCGSEMKDLVREISWIELTKMMDFNILNSHGLVKGQGVVEFLDKHIPAETFEDLDIPLRVIATDFWNRKQVVFDSGPLIPAIRASISIPGIFKPVVIDQRIMTDGGSVNPVPMSLIRDECDILIAIDVSGTNVPPQKKPMPTTLDAVMTTFQIMETAFVENQIKIHKPEIFLKPPLVNFEVLDFHRHKEIMSSVKKEVELLKSQVKDELEKEKVSASPQKNKWFFWKR
jgi:NTE family protein